MLFDCSYMDPISTANLLKTGGSVISLAVKLPIESMIYMFGQLSTNRFADALWIVLLLYHAITTTWTSFLQHFGDSLYQLSRIYQCDLFSRLFNGLAPGGCDSNF